MRQGPSSRVGDQLELALGDVRLKLPWNGRSPRELCRLLTRSLYFQRKRGGHVSDLIPPQQLMLFEQEVPLPKGGAPLLLPFLYSSVKGG